MKSDWYLRKINYQITANSILIIMISQISEAKRPTISLKNQCPLIAENKKLILKEVI